MATKADFTAEEWNQIRRAPFMAAPNETEEGRAKNRRTELVVEKR
jgi:hypothetical protein